jgi:RNA polymerase sigma-70 factor (ECF subfamily)
MNARSHRPATPAYAAQAEVAASGQDPAEAALISADALLDRLILEHRTAVTAYVRRILGDHHLAEDVVQETFLRAWRHAEKLQAGTGSVRGWLMTVARNIGIDKLRSAAVRHEYVSDEPSEFQPTWDDHASRVAGDDVVEQLLGQLSPEQRSVVYLSVIVGLTSEETAARLGLPTGTVKSRKHYALRSLRQHVDVGVNRPLVA